MHVHVFVSLSKQQIVANNAYLAAITLSFEPYAARWERQIRDRVMNEGGQLYVNHLNGPTREPNSMELPQGVDDVGNYLKTDSAITTGEPDWTDAHKAKIARAEKRVGKNARRMRRTNAELYHAENARIEIRVGLS